MNKEKIARVLYCISIALVICFGIILLIDYIKYDSISTSFPFYATVIVRSIEILLPSIITFIIGFILKRIKRGN